MGMVGMACMGSSFTNVKDAQFAKGWHCMGHGPLHGMYRQLNHKCKKKLGFQKVVLVAAQAGVAWAMGRCMTCIGSSVTNAKKTQFPKSCASSSTGWHCMGHGPLRDMYRQLNVMSCQLYFS